MDKTLSDKSSDFDQATIYFSFSTSDGTNQTMEGDLTFSDMHKDPNKTLEATENILKTKNNMEKLSLSPLRPFNKNIANNSNAFSSTPSKDQNMINMDTAHGLFNSFKQIANVTEKIVDKENVNFMHNSMFLEHELPNITNGNKTVDDASTVSKDSTSVTLESKDLLGTTTNGDNTQDKNTSVTHLSIHEGEQAMQQTTEQENAILKTKTTRTEICHEHVITSNENLTIVENGIENNSQMKALITELSNITLDSNKIVSSDSVLEESINKKEAKETVVSECITDAILAPKSVEAEINQTTLETKKLLANIVPIVAEKQNTENKPFVGKNTSKSSDNKVPSSTATKIANATEIALNDNISNSKLPKIRRSFVPRKSTMRVPRMSILIKTTLNSPACKQMIKNGPKADIKNRKSLMPDSSLNLNRRSFIPPPSNCNKVRQFLHPTNSATKTTEIATISKTSRQTITPSTSTSINTSPTEYKCNACGITFRIKSLLDAHKHTHEAPMLRQTYVNKTNATHNDLSSASLFTTNKCKYCDKKFALARALHIHLMQNCTKIPPREKRKLEFTELNHVEKAQLPSFTHANATSSIEHNKIAEKDKIKSEMPPPTNAVKKPRAKVPHAGVFRTPTKNVPCHICKQSFKNILDYTNHCLAMHSSNSIDKLADATKIPHTKK